MSRRYLIVDDHPIIRGALRESLLSIAPDCEILTAGRLSETLRMLRAAGPVDLVLFDLHLPDAGGVEGLIALRGAHPESAVAIFSAEADASMIIRCLDLGAIGYIPKVLGDDAMLEALRTVTGGGAYVPPQVLDNEPPLRLRTTSGEVCTDPKRLGLTERQVDVLRLILRGLPNKLICRQLGLAEGTVKVHVSAVLRALAVRNRTQAVLAVSRMGLKLSH